MSTATMPTLAQAHLDAMKADPTLRHTGARWRAHEAVFPGKGALDLAARCAARDAALAAKITVARDDHARKLGADHDETRYLDWLLEQLRGDL